MKPAASVGAFPLADFVRPRPVIHPVSMHRHEAAVAPLSEQAEPPSHLPPSMSEVRVASASQGPPIFHVYLGRWGFCLCWWIVVFVHAFIGGFAFCVTALHRYLQDEKVSQSVNALHVPTQTLQSTARMFFVIGFAHFIAIVRLIRNSVRARELIFHTTKPKRKFTKTKQALACLQPMFRMYDTVFDAWAKLFSPTGLFGFSGAYFESMFLCREAWEILMQTYQAYKLSQSVPRKWINQLAVTAIVLNCVSSPLVHFLFRKNEGLRRVFNLVLDAVLDLCCSIMIPLSVISPYIGVYDTALKRFPNELLLNDVWFVNAISETRQVLVTSVPDFISTVMPQLSLLGYLMTFKNILRRRSTSVQDQSTYVFPLAARDAIRASVTQAMSPPIPPPIQGPTLKRKTVFSRLVATNGAVRRSTIRVAERLRRDPSALREWLSAFAHLLFVAWGVAVLGFHLDALHNTDRHVPGCQLHVSAWHSDGFPCSVMLLNCHSSGVGGSVEQTTAVLNQLARSSLQVLIFSHCPALHVAPVVAEFDQLAGLEFFNCTLADWPVEAALREEQQPRVGYVYFILSNWTSFPAGLLHDELPAQFKHLSVIANNLTELPENIDLWGSQNWISLNFDRVPNLQVLPESLCRLRATSLWFANSGLTSFPKDCMMNMQFVELALSGSPVETLPDVVGSNLHTLLLEYTNLSAAPAWFLPWEKAKPAKEVFMYGSPACNTSELQSDAARWAGFCGEDVGTTGGQYPWSIMLPLRAYE